MESSQEIKIKPLSIADARRAAKIYNQSLLYLSREKEISGEKMEEFIKKAESFLGAYLNNLLVGHLLLRKKRGGGLDIGIVIDSKYQGKKIGSRLIKRGIELAQSKKYKKIVVDILEYNLPAIKFFESNGFKKTGLSKRLITKKGEKTKLLRYAYKL
jgi:ribosomal protein S18 acetylase RimI-like enzyme